MLWGLPFSPQDLGDTILVVRSTTDSSHHIFVVILFVLLWIQLYLVMLCFKFFVLQFCNSGSQKNIFSLCLSCLFCSQMSFHRLESHVLDIQRTLLCFNGTSHPDLYTAGQCSYIYTGIFCSYLTVVIFLIQMLVSSTRCKSLDVDSFNRLLDQFKVPSILQLSSCFLHTRRITSMCDSPLKNNHHPFSDTTGLLYYTYLNTFTCHCVFWRQELIRGQVGNLYKNS